MDLHAVSLPDVRATNDLLGQLRRASVPPNGDPGMIPSAGDLPHFMYLLSPESKTPVSRDTWKARLADYHELDRDSEGIRACAEFLVEWIAKHPKAPGSVEGNPESLLDEDLHPIKQPHVTMAQEKPRFVGHDGWLPDGLLSVRFCDQLACLRLSKFPFTYGKEARANDWQLRSIRVHRSLTNSLTGNVHRFNETWTFPALRDGSDKQQILSHIIPSQMDCFHNGILHARFVTIALLMQQNWLDVVSFGLHPYDTKLVSVKTSSLSFEDYATTVPALRPLLQASLETLSSR